MLIPTLVINTLKNLIIGDFINFKNIFYLIKNILKKDVDFLSFILLGYYVLIWISYCIISIYLIHFCYFIIIILVVALVNNSFEKKWTKHPTPIIIHPDSILFHKITWLVFLYKPYGDMFTLISGMRMKKIKIIEILITLLYNGLFIYIFGAPRFFLMYFCKWLEILEYVYCGGGILEDILFYQWYEEASQLKLRLSNSFFS